MDRPTGSIILTIDPTIRVDGSSSVSRSAIDDANVLALTHEVPGRTTVFAVPVLWLPVAHQIESDRVCRFAAHQDFLVPTRKNIRTSQGIETRTVVVAHVHIVLGQRQREVLRAEPLEDDPLDVFRRHRAT